MIPFPATPNSLFAPTIANQANLLTANSSAAGQVMVVLPACMPQAALSGHLDAGLTQDDRAKSEGFSCPAMPKKKVQC